MKHVRTFTAAIRRLAGARTRQGMTVCRAIVLAGLVVDSAQGQTKKTTADSQITAPEKRTFLHQEVEFNASSRRIYEILLDSKQFSALTGLPAEISAQAGGTFSMFGGRIVGRNIELVPNQRIVQAWRDAIWSGACIRSLSLNSKSRVQKQWSFLITPASAKAILGISSRVGNRAIGILYKSFLPQALTINR